MSFGRLHCPAPWWGVGCGYPHSLSPGALHPCCSGFLLAWAAQQGTGSVPSLCKLRGKRGRVPAAVLSWAELEGGGIPAPSGNLERKNSIKPGPWAASGPLSVAGDTRLLALCLPDILSVLLLWNAGREGCLCWSQFPVSHLGTREQPGHHGHGASGQCQVPEHLLSAHGASSSPGILPGGQMWQPKNGTWGGGARVQGRSDCLSMVEMCPPWLEKVTISPQPVIDTRLFINILCSE